MQKNLLVKTLIIIAVLLIFVYGMLGIPKGFSGTALKQSIADRIHLGLDLKGGTHLILQVQVNDAINAETDRAIEALKDELSKAHVTYGDISKPDPNQPEKIAIKGVPVDSGSTVRGIVGDRFQDYTLGNGPDNSLTLTLKPERLTQLKTDTLEKSIDAIRNLVDSLGVSEPSI